MLWILSTMGSLNAATLGNHRYDNLNFIREETEVVNEKARFDSNMYT